MKQRKRNPKKRSPKTKEKQTKRRKRKKQGKEREKRRGPWSLRLSPLFSFFLFVFFFCFFSTVLLFFCFFLSSFFPLFCFFLFVFCRRRKTGSVGGGDNLSEATKLAWKGKILRIFLFFFLFFSFFWDFFCFFFFSFSFFSFFVCCPRLPTAAGDLPWHQRGEPLSLGCCDRFEPACEPQKKKSKGGVGKKEGKGGKGTKHSSPSFPSGPPTFPPCEQKKPNKKEGNVPSYAMCIQRYLFLVFSCWLMGRNLFFLPFYKQSKNTPFGTNFVGSKREEGGPSKSPLSSFFEPTPLPGGA